jgi:hypothetical protein
MNRFQESEDKKTMTIACRRFHKLTDVLYFIEALHKLPKYDHYVFDFSQLGFVCTFGLLYTSNQINALVSKKKKSQIKVKFKNDDINATDETRFANFMGYFRACGFSVGVRVGTAKGNSNYQPITKIETDYFWKESHKNFTKPGYEVENHAKKIAKVLLHSESGNLLKMVTWSVREILRNAVEHSHSKHLEYAAQYWPSKHRAEIAILDNGIGIRESIQNNPYLEIEDDRDAIQYALLPAVSGKMYKGVKKKPHDAWQNSGYGLYNTSRLCRNGNGNFFICSGSSGFKLIDENRDEHITSFRGTAVRMVLDTANQTDLEYLLKKFVKEGDEIARTLRGTAKIKASAASRMVRTDFK